jgi:hypothetical protein
MMPLFIVSEVNVKIKKKQKRCTWDMNSCRKAMNVLEHKTGIKILYLAPGGTQIITT